MLHHTTASTTPAAPTMKNIQRQLNRSMRNVSNGTAMKLPSDEADCKRPVANPALANAEPVPHHSRSARKQRRFADTQCEARRDEDTEAIDQAAGRLRDRPAEESQPEESARAEPVDQTAYRQLSKCVGPQESGKQQAHLGDRDSEVVLNELVGHGERSSIDVIQRASGNQEDDRPTLNRNDSRRRLGYVSGDTAW